MSVQATTEANALADILAWSLRRPLWQRDALRRLTQAEELTNQDTSAGLRERQPSGRRGTGPRLHDLRHTMAVRTLVDWYRSGLDPDREMYKLSAWLGHGSPDETYWYLEAVPELLHLATERAERATAGGKRHEGL